MQEHQPQPQPQPQRPRRRGRGQGAPLRFAARTSVAIEPEVVEGYHRLAARLGTTYSEQLRIALHERLERESANDDAKPRQPQLNP